MKTHFKIIVLFIIFFFINVSKSDITDQEKNSINQLITLYNLPLSIPLDDYCSTQYFKCNISKDVIREIYLDGGDTSPVIPDNSIFKSFIFATILNIKNTNIQYDTFPAEILGLKNLTLTSSKLNLFPTSIPSLESLSFNDVTFSGYIYLSKISRIQNFYISYSSQDKMSDYLMVDDIAIPQSNYPNRHYSLYLNNLANFTNFGQFLQMDLYLGNNFDMESLKYLSTLKSSYLEVYRGFNTIPLEIPSLSIIDIATLSFNNINFKSDYIFDFSNLFGIIRFDGCTGLKNSNDDLNLILGNRITDFVYINSDLTKFPSVLSNSGIKYITLKNNKITGQLPPLPLPLDSKLVYSLDLSDNEFEGEIPQNYCYNFFNLTNNKLSGKLLDCIICSLNVSRIRSTIQGNQFSNYVSGTTDFNQFPKCPGIIISNTPSIAISSYSFINGENFGWDSVIIEENGNGYNAITSKPNLPIQISIPNREIYAMVLLSAYNAIIQNNYKFELYVKSPNLSATVTTTLSNPIVNSVNFRAEYNIGYSFIFIGSGLPFAENDKSNGNVTIDGTICVITVATGQFLACSLPKPQLPEKEYEAIIYNSQTNLYGSIKFKFQRVAPWISAVYPAPPSGGIVTLFGSFSDGPYNNLTVNIGKLNCDIKTVDAYTLTCNIGAGTGVQNISLTLNGTTFFSVNSFRYTDSILDCPDCGEYGFCDTITGYCVCHGGFNGENCQQIFVKDPIIQVNKTLVQIIKDGYQFGFRLKDIKEFDINSNVVKMYSLATEDWSLTSDSTERKFTYIHKVNSTTISYTVEQIVGSPKEFSFAGQNYTLQPGSIKLSASILNWDYLGSLNTLKLQIESTAKSDIKNDCDGSSITTNGDGTSINYLSIQKGENILFGRFVDKVLSDSRPTFSSVTVENQTDDSIIVSLSLPFCKECLLDPDFSVLINNNVGNCSSQNKAKWIIPTAIVVSLVGFVIIFMGAYVLLKDKVYISFKKGNFGIVILKKSRSNTSTTISMSDD